MWSSISIRTAAYVAVPLFIAGLIALPLASVQAQDVVGGDGTSTTFNDVISSTAVDQLLAVTVNLPNVAHTCHVTASSATLFGGDGRYIFGLRESALSTDPPLVATERSIEYTNNAGVNDVGFLAVSSNFSFTGMTGTRTFRWSARKSAVTGADMTVDSSTMSVVCVLNTL